jgi:hypothetical protein
VVNFYYYFIFTEARMARMFIKIRCNKNEKNIYVCISQCWQALSSRMGLERGIKLRSLIEKSALGVALLG